MELKTTNLRIGNYIWDDYSGVMIIHQISNDLVYCKKENHLPSGRYDIQSIKPIVIDGNWLLKLGFNYIGGNYYLDHGSIEIGLMTSKRFYLQIRSENTTLDIKYIHQLQNFWHVLTGKELTPTNL